MFTFEQYSHHCNDWGLPNNYRRYIQPKPSNRKFSTLFAICLTSMFSHFDKLCQNQGKAKIIRPDHKQPNSAPQLCRVFMSCPSLVNIFRVEKFNRMLQNFPPKSMTSFYIESCNFVKIQLHQSKFIKTNWPGPN